MLVCIMAIQNESDRNLVEELYQEYGSTMLYIAQGILHDHALAEDAVCETFIKIIDNLEKFSFKNCNKTRGLVVIILKHVCLNVLKSRKKEQIENFDDLESIPENHENFPLEYAVSAENYEFIRSCVSELNENYRMILTLKLYYDYSDEEISKLLEISQENVRVRFHRARSTLISKMKKGEAPDE